MENFDAIPIYKQSVKVSRGLALEIAKGNLENLVLDQESAGQTLAVST